MSDKRTRVFALFWASGLSNVNKLPVFRMWTTSDFPNRYFIALPSAHKLMTGHSKRDLRQRVWAKTAVSFLNYINSSKHIYKSLQECRAAKFCMRSRREILHECRVAKFRVDLALKILRPNVPLFLRRMTVSSSNTLGWWGNSECYNVYIKHLEATVHWTMDIYHKIAQNWPLLSAMPQYNDNLGRPHLMNALVIMDKPPWLWTSFMYSS